VGHLANVLADRCLNCVQTLPTGCANGVDSQLHVLLAFLVANRVFPTCSHLLGALKEALRTR